MIDCLLCPQVIILFLLVISAIFKKSFPFVKKKMSQLNFFLDFFGALFEYTKMDYSMKMTFINDIDLWWWPSSDKEVSSPGGFFNR